MASQCSQCKNELSPSSCETFFSSSTCRSCRTENDKYLHKIKTSLWDGYQELAVLWNKAANGVYLPEDVAVQSNTVFVFTCACGENFSSSPNNRWRAKSIDCNSCASVKRGQANSRVQSQSVADVDFLMAQWDKAKNLADPRNVAFRSNKTFWWVCDLGHSTESSVCNKYKGNGCRICVEELFESMGERTLHRFVDSLVSEEVVRKSRSYIHPYELDVVIEGLGKAIEYNGDHWHSNKKVMEKKGITNVEYHTRKLEAAKRVGLELCFVWDDEWKTKRKEVEEDLKKWLLDGVPLVDLPRLSRLTSGRD